MIWINPAAAIALLGAAAPILIHLLVQRHAPRLPFPTLRFIRPVHIAAVRRRSLDDALLLAVRILIIGAAVAAVAGPFLVTAARRSSWNARTIRAAVIASAGDQSAAADRVFAADEMREGVRRAVAWLETQPPARREILVRSPFPLGAIDASDLAAVPIHIGLRFERTGSLPARRDIAAPPVLRLIDRNGALQAIERRIVLEGDRTGVREAGRSDAGATPIEIFAPADQQAFARAVLADVLAAGVVAPPAGRAAQITLSSSAAPPIDSRSIAAPWMVDAADRIARDLAERAARGQAVPNVRFSFGDRLLVATSAGARDPSIPALLRLVGAALAPPPAQSRAEILPLSDAQLRAWSREPVPAQAPQKHSIDRDDRRWLWLLIVVLLGLEAWLRRPRPTAAIPRERDQDEEARVA